MGVGDGAAGADGAIGPDLNPFADHGVRSDQRTCANRDGGTDHRERIDRNIRSYLRRRMHHRARRDPLGAERRDRTQCTAIHMTGDRDERLVGLAHVHHGDPGRRVVREPFGGQDRARLARCERFCVLGVFHEGQVARTGAVDRCDAGDDARQIGTRARVSSRECGNFCHAHAR